MESFAWAEAAAASLADEQSPRIVAIALNGAAQGIAQLARIRASALGRLEMLGVGRLNEPSDFVFSDHAALTALISEVVKLRRPMLLNRLPATSPTMNVLQTASRRRGMVVVRPQASCPVISLDETWVEPESHLSARRRSDFRRAVRRAEQEGRVQYEILSPARDQLEGLLDLCFDIEARSWKGEAGTALKHDSIRGSFIRAFARSAADAGSLPSACLRSATSTPPCRLRWNRPMRCGCSKSDSIRSWAGVRQARCCLPRAFGGRSNGN